MQLCCNEFEVVLRNCPQVFQTQASQRSPKEHPITQQLQDEQGPLGLLNLARFAKVSKPMHGMKDRSDREFEAWFSTLAVENEKDIQKVGSNQNQQLSHEKKLLG